MKQNNLDNLFGNPLEQLDYIIQSLEIGDNK